MSRVLYFSAIVFGFGLVSCATVSKVGKGSVAFVKNTSSATANKVSSISELAVNKVMPPKIHVVEVREHQLKDMPSGHEKALAFENTKKRGFWFFKGPVDFVEPTLPEPPPDEPVEGVENIDILLPPNVD